MTATQSGNHLVLDAGEMQLVADLGHGVPEIVHLGSPLEPAAVELLAAVSRRPVAKGTLDVEAPALMCPEHGSGWVGRPGLRGSRSDGSGWAPRFQPREVRLGDRSASVGSVDETAGLGLVAEFNLRPRSVRARLTLTNLGDDAYSLDELTVTIPVPEHARELLHLTGRWVHEFTRNRRPWSAGAVQVDNRRGRTSHDRVPAMIAGSAGFDENRGDVWGVVLGWSGNSILAADQLTDGRRVIQLGELLASGEVVLGTGQSYSTPWVEVVASGSGLNAVSQALHASIRSEPHHPTAARPRQVLFNTWEAVYFDHDLSSLQSLAQRAAEVGVERFVLDDGWFHGRRNDRAGLGDWWVDEDVWPDGLGPIIGHVRRLGMEFGIWVEPEMVNSDSELFRHHPEWVLAADGYEPVTGRGQLVLDVGRPDVCSHLLEKLDRLLADNDISYVKWDMNRDLVHASRGGRAATHSFVVGMYDLLDQLRARHPGVEFESCASGGGRADFEMLKRSERIWTSDSNDALERQRIQSGFSLLFPPEVMGAHIGPPRSHTSGRTHGLGFRAATAFFGHLGVEWNLLEATDADRTELAAAIDLHKRHRALLHTGEVWRVDVDDRAAIAHMIVGDGAGEALLSFAQLEPPESSVPSRLRLHGLDRGTEYRISVLPLAEVKGPALAQPDWIRGGTVVPGSLLIDAGLQPPLLHPETAIVVHLVAD